MRPDKRASSRHRRSHGLYLPHGAAEKELSEIFAGARARATRHGMGVDAGLRLARRRVGEEMGDLLLSLVNLSRFLEVEAEDCLGDAAARFLRRFAHVEARIEGQGRKLRDASLEEMDLFWEEAKRMERE